MQRKNGVKKYMQLLRTLTYHWREDGPHPVRSVWFASRRGSRIERRQRENDVSPDTHSGTTKERASDSLSLARR